MEPQHSFHCRPLPGLVLSSCLGSVEYQPHLQRWELRLRAHPSSRGEGGAESKGCPGLVALMKTGKAHSRELGEGSIG